MNRNKAINSFFFFLILLVANPSESTVFQYMGLEKQIRKANFIVNVVLKDKQTGEYVHKFKGRAVENNQPVEFDVTRTSISTFFDFEIIDVLMGDITEKNIKVMVVGGCYKDRCEEYSHSYDFEIGEEAVLFLKKGDDGIYYASNSSFDVFSINSNKELIRKTDSILYPEGWGYANKAINNKNLNISILKSKIKEVSNEK